MAKKSKFPKGINAPKRRPVDLLADEVVPWWKKLLFT